MEKFTTILIYDYFLMNIATVHRANMNSLQSSYLVIVVCVPKLDSVELKPVLICISILSPWW